MDCKLLDSYVTKRIIKPKDLSIVSNIVSGIENGNEELCYTYLTQVFVLKNPKNYLEIKFSEALSESSCVSVKCEPT